jgi:Tfp pilus assembly protein PilX
MMNTIQRQRGSTLLVSLIMLVVLTLFVVTSINTSNINLKIVGSEQAHKAMEYAAQQAIEQVISTSSNFTTPMASTTVAVNAGTVNAGSVSITKPECMGTSVSTGYSLQFNLAPEDTNWDIRATVTDANSGATAEISQGLKIRLPSGSCP